MLFLMGILRTGGCQRKRDGEDKRVGLQVGVAVVQVEAGAED